MNPEDRPQPSTFVDPSASYQHTPGSGLASYPLLPQITWTATTRDGNYAMIPPLGSPTVGQPLPRQSIAAFSNPAPYPSATATSPVSIPIGGNATVDAVLSHQVNKSMLPISARSEQSQVSKTLLIESALPSLP